MVKDYTPKITGLYPENKYDFVLMDVQMPIMDGLQASQAIRSHQNVHIKEIPIVAMTADAFAEDVTACMEAGMDGHVAKPIDMDKLFQEVRRVLKAKKLGA